MGFSALHVPQPLHGTCSTCGETTEAVVRCLDCGPHVRWCEGCAVTDHVLRPYHVIEKWMVRTCTDIMKYCAVCPISNKSNVTKITIMFLPISNNSSSRMRLGTLNPTLQVLLVRNLCALYIPAGLHVCCSEAVHATVKVHPPVSHPFASHNHSSER